MPTLGSGPALRLPPWVTRRAVDAAQTLLHEAAANAVPLAPTRSQHATVAELRGVGHLTRHIGATMARSGLPLAAPFLDDRVVEACLAVRPHERSTLWRFKPLIVEAMRDLVPAAVLQRTTKGDFSADGHTGLRHARPHFCLRGVAAFAGSEHPRRHDGSVAITQPQSMKRGGERPLRQRPAALLAVGAARMLAHLPPRRIRTVLTLLRRIRGVWPTWCIGVRTAPFVAHAWVEVEGTLVGEPQGPGYYRPLIVISPVVPPGA